MEFSVWLKRTLKSRNACEQSSKAGLFEMLIVSKGVRELVLTHDLKRNAVGVTPGLVLVGRRVLESRAKLNARKRDYLAVWVRLQSFNELRRGGTKCGTLFTEVIQQFR